ncbi:MAG: hypothetical protein GX100_09390 [candidate division WS1 bacterium]|jgi:hypothetical protein|nr:hypothetical protein [candidate division WS1 bacterium]
MTTPVFNARRRSRQRNLAGLVLFLAGTLPFMTGLLILDLLPDLEQTHVGTLMAAALIALAAMLLWLLQGRVALLGNTELRRELHHRLGAEAAGEFVGFSPGAEIRSWEGETDLDVGFLNAEGNSLIYRGDRYSWSLPRQAVDDIRLLALGEEPAQPLTPVRVALYWHGSGDPGRVFTLASREGDRLQVANENTRRLAELLLAWWENPAPEEQPGPRLGMPPTDLRGGVPVDQPAPGSCLSALSVGIIAAALLWETTGKLLREFHYNRAVLWAGLILMGAIVLIAHVLSYLQVHESRQPPSPPRS